MRDDESPMLALAHMPKKQPTKIALSIFKAAKALGL
jgi:hypothetical protein